MINKLIFRYSLILFALCFFVCNPFTTLAQGRTCGTVEHYKKAMQKDPKVGARAQEIETLMSAAAVPISPEQIIVIPVVVHVVYNGNFQNISNAQIQSQINVLNEDFGRRNPDAALTPTVFANLASDSRIFFCLASKDPQGNNTNGVTRTSTTVTSFSDNDDVKYTSKGGKNIWPANRYLNIWVCNLTDPSINSNGLLGYAQFPGQTAETDGVVIDFEAFGRMGTATAPFNLGRTATHEVGHWFNLKHIWGDDKGGCSGTDNVDDTPNQGSENYRCPSFPRISCSNSPNGDMFMNFMDYTDDGCMNLFTIGQRDRMRSAISVSRSSFVNNQCTTCLSSYTITENQSGRITYYGYEYITASSTIASNSNVNFLAGNNVKLLPGFTAVSGSNFRAAIEQQGSLNCYPSLSGYISGPVRLDRYLRSTWTAVPAFGNGSYEYHWTTSTDNGNTWYDAGNSQSISTMLYNSNLYMRCVITSGNETSTLSQSVSCNNCTSTSNQTLSVAPNPASSYIDVTIIEDKSSTMRVATGREYTVFDSFGTIVFTQKSTQKLPMRINTDKLKTGVYYLLVKTEAGIVQKTILIQK